MQALRILAPRLYARADSECMAEDARASILRSNMRKLQANYGMGEAVKKNIKLPNNAFGIAIMLILLLLVIIVPFVVTFWLVSLVAPWWVCAPVGMAASFAAIFSSCTFDNK